MSFSLFKKLFCFGLALWLLVLPTPKAIATPLDPCLLREESFGFTIDDYAIEHQEWAILDIAVDFRYVDQPTAQRKNYINLVPIAAEIDRFLKAYPNETDYWEIVNRHLTELIFANHPQMSALKIKIDIAKGSKAEPYARHSVVSLTRDQGCPLTP
ncbi:hypothetical protein AWQ21_05500 [Picosynechococcus sp. PCC 7003]|uniref:hypothetical protein n=1 Tax=Picosynechococcus sp. PCC 7003 TaxID=374981 RepID=UPI000810EE92|nr:hypothetical protein [Picosynechococcus sp. PCC 7003]ANV83884.1 hypothetical protein AWQ21_05500 [Picosynechococcus sp. PCC 7003]